MSYSIIFLILWFTFESGHLSISLMQKIIKLVKGDILEHKYKFEDL